MQAHTQTSCGQEPASSRFARAAHALVLLGRGDKALVLDTTPLHDDDKLEVSAPSRFSLLCAPLLSTCCFHACSRMQSHFEHRCLQQLQVRVTGYFRLDCLDLAQPLPLEVRADNVQIRVSTATATVQDTIELMRWLEDMGVSSPAHKRLFSKKFLHRPSLTTTQANFASLRGVLRMDDSQARLQCHVETTARRLPPASVSSNGRGTTWTVNLRQLDSVCTTRSGPGSASNPDFLDN